MCENPTHELRRAIVSLRCVLFSARGTGCSLSGTTGLNYRCVPLPAIRFTSLLQRSVDATGETISQRQLEHVQAAECEESATCSTAQLGVNVIPITIRPVSNVL